MVLIVNKEFKTSTPTDSEIVFGILNNSESAIKRLYVAYFPMVMQLIINNNGSADDDKDIYQEAIILLNNKIKKGEFELNSKLKTFLYSVCRRLWLNRLSQMNRYGGDLHDFQEYSPVEDEVEDQAERNMQFGKMQSALGMLGEPCKTIIEEFYILN